MSCETATFAAGCFWGVEATFRKVAGVIATRVGYTGGGIASPSYEQVCSGETGHAEACEVTYDPDAVSFENLLEVFWACHDPTTPNRQGPDVGSQYRSAVFAQDEAQLQAALASKEAVDTSARFPHPVVTEVLPSAEFWPAEEEHQQYLEKRGQSNCGS